MDTIQTSPQTLNVLFTFLSQLRNTVVWVCTADYKKQLFLSDGFEDIWGIPKEHMFNNMAIWGDTIYDEDLAIIKSELANRHKTNNQCNVVNFRINRPDNKIRCLSSSSYTLLDNNGKPSVIIGVDENLQPEQWHHQTKNIKIPSSPLIKDLSQILSNELRLTSPTTENVISATTIPESSTLPKEIIVNNKVVPLTHREGQCLVYLIQGRSAKETAYFLKLSTRTVETYLDKIRSKTNCRTKMALIGKLQQQQNLIV